MDGLAIAVTLEKGLTSGCHLLLVLLLIVHGRTLINARGVAIGDRGCPWTPLLSRVHGRAMLLERVHSRDLVRLGLVLIRTVADSAA